MVGFLIWALLSHCLELVCVSVFSYFTGAFGFDWCSKIVLEPMYAKIVLIGPELDQNRKFKKKNIRDFSGRSRGARLSFP